MTNESTISFIDRSGKIILTGKYSDLTKMLVEIRESSGLSQRDVAAKMKINQAYIAQVETGFPAKEKEVVIHPLWIKRYLMACGKYYKIEIK